MGAVGVNLHFELVDGRVILWAETFPHYYAPLMWWPNETAFESFLKEGLELIAKTPLPDYLLKEFDDPE